MGFEPKHLDDGGIVYAEPIPSQEELNAYYASQYYQTSDGKKNTYDFSYTDNEIKYKQLESKMILESLKQIAAEKPINSFLEIGCGEGFLLAEARKTGLQVEGVDYSKYGISKWNPGLEKYCVFGDAIQFIEESTRFKKQYDAIVLKNVLEHVREPGKLLQILRPLLHENTFLLTTVPNDYSNIQRLAMERGHIDREFWFAPPDHLYYFNTKNIRPFFENYNYQVKDMFSSFPIDFYLFHSGSNYIMDRTRGKEAHFARISLDLMMAEEGMDKLLSLYRAMAQCGVGRDITIIVKKEASFES